MFRKKLLLQSLILFNLLLMVFYFISNFLLSSITMKFLFNLDGESSIPTWFSTIQLFSLFTLTIFYSLGIKDKHLRRFYYLIGFMFLFFSVDEAAMIHEKIAKIFITRSIHSWILFYPVILIVLMVLSLKGLLKFFKEKEGRTAFITGALLFSAGGMGWEMWGYYMDTESVIYKIQVVLEESFELLGESFMLYALMSKNYFHLKIIEENLGITRVIKEPGKA